MLLRLRGPDGMVRLNVDNNDTFADLGRLLLEQLPKSVDPATITMSNSPTSRGDSKKLLDIARFRIGQVGFKHGDMIFISYQHTSSDPASSANNQAAQTPLIASLNQLNGQPVLPSEVPPPPQQPNRIERLKNAWEVVQQSPLDDRLDKQSGKIPRKRDAKMCRHGPKGMCDYCMPLDPFNQSYLDEKKIKYMSVHSYMRKTNSATNKPELGSSFIPPLVEPYFRVKPDCPSGHAQWPDGICTKCQPSAITLQPQPFRMVDHVEFASPTIVDSFIDAWRRTGAQRFGYLYGRYAEYDVVPLGIKAVVEVIYEPPQVDEMDGISLNPWENRDKINHVAKLCNLELIGVIWTDLMDSGNGDGSVVCKRHVESYFMTSQEVCFAARLQAEHPKPSKWSDTGIFGSNMATCIISGNESGEISISAYQASNDAVEMVRANIIEPSADPTVMLVQEEEELDGSRSRSRYISEVFYRRINEYGANVQENAKPSFPVEYLFVTLTHGFPDTPRPVFPDLGFPIENREYLGEAQDHSIASKILRANEQPNDDPLKISNFHLLCFLYQMDVLSPDEMNLLCCVVTSNDLAFSFQLRDTTGWQTLLAILQSTGERIPKRARVGASEDDLALNPTSGSMTGRHASTLGGRDPDERLTKRFAAFRLGSRPPS